MYYKQPRYFSDFHCIGGECPENCCNGWRIDWSRKEIDKLSAAENISPELSELVKTSFVPNEDIEGMMLVKCGENGKCPFLTEEGLCRIQKELGAEYLSYTCTIYPRINIYSGDRFYRFCRISCPVTVKRLLNDGKSMDLIALPTEKQGTVYPANDLDDYNKNPEQKYRPEIFEFFCELISEKSISVEVAIILGALAAQELARMVDMLDIEKIPERLKSLRKELHGHQVLQSAENLKPQKQIKLGFLSLLSEQVVGDAVTAALHQNKALDMELYAHGEEKLAEALKGREWFLRNVALQLLFEFDVPFEFASKSIFENYSLFAAAFGMIKTNLIAAMAVDKPLIVSAKKQEFSVDGDDKLVTLTALFTRGLCQNTAKEQKIIELLEKHEFNKPPFLGILVK